MTRMILSVFGILAIGTVCIALSGCNGGSDSDVDPQMQQQRPVGDTPIDPPGPTAPQQGQQ